MKKIIISIGVVVFLIGSILQAKYFSQGYTKFIEGEGYITFMAGLIIIILGLAFDLFTGEITDEGRSNND